MAIRTVEMQTWDSGRCAGLSHIPGQRVAEAGTQARLQPGSATVGPWQANLQLLFAGPFSGLDSSLGSFPDQTSVEELQLLGI